MKKDEIIALYSLIKGTRIKEIAMEVDDVKITLRQKDEDHYSQKRRFTKTGESGAHLDRFVISDQVGYFSFGAKPVVSIGDSLNEDTPVGSVDTLGTVNVIFSKQKGRVVEILVREGAAIEYGQPLLKVR